MEFLAVLEEIEGGVKRILDEVADDDPGDLDLEAVEDADDKVMGEGRAALTLLMARAMEFPSEAPIQMGRIFLPLSSLRTTM